MPDRDLESADNRRQIKLFPKRQRFAINNHFNSSPPPMSIGGQIQIRSAFLPTRRRIN
jgi:hypothetical protein